jgi:hypothetical protein
MPSVPEGEPRTPAVAERATARPHGDARRKRPAESRDEGRDEQPSVSVERDSRRGTRAPSPPLRPSWLSGPREGGGAVASRIPRVITTF